MQIVINTHTHTHILKIAHTQMHMNLPSQRSGCARTISEKRLTAHVGEKLKKQLIVLPRLRAKGKGWRKKKKEADINHIMPELN